MSKIQFVLLLIASTLLSPASCNIPEIHMKFLHSHYTVTETKFSTADVEIIRNVTSETPSIVCKLPNNASSDFFSIEVVCVPVESSSLPTCCCKFYVLDDDLPEDDETFPVSLITPNVISPVLMNDAFITITYNDDPYGKIGFADSSQSVTTTEPNSANGMTVLSFNLTRHGGLFGIQSVFWKIFDFSNKTSVQDIHPSQGYVNMTNGREYQNFSVNILPDDIPEDTETFTLQLLSVTGGSILTNNVNYEIKINENDAPLRFKSSQLTCPETHICSITVLRGIGLDGLRIGPIDHDATVSFRTVNGTASPGIDYVETINNLVFLAGETEKQIELKILDDTTPENDEYFSIMLVHVTAGVILKEANSANIIISKNDDPHGLVSFENPSKMKSYVFREDINTNYSIPVLRTKGLLGNISVFWNLRSIGPDTTSMAFEPSSGSLHFLDGIATVNISLDIRNDDEPSAANKYRLSITKVTGGARILPSSNYGDASVEIIVADSDNAYGVVQFSSDEPNLSFFGGVRRIEAKVKRSGGTLADIYVQYEIHYYTGSLLNPVPGVLVKEKGVVNLQQGETEVVIVGFINQNVFLKSGSQFVMMLTNATIGTSLIISPLTPRLGTSVSKSITISPHLANGEIGFSNTNIVHVAEPAAQGKTVHLALERDGTAERSMVYWALEAQDTSVNPELDLRPTSGMVILGKGVAQVNISIEVLPDEYPEMDEVFQIRLVNVTGWNERLRDDATSLTLIISRNDDPGGVFEFSSVVPIVMKEEDSSAQVRVVRTGGALEKQFIEMLIVNGTEDFNAFKQFNLFQKDEREKTFFIVPKDEEKPELNETFLIKMVSYAGSKVGAKSEFYVTILQNDDPHGVISFSQDDVQTVRKLYERNPSKVLFRLLRTKGTFGDVVVSWKIRPLDTSNSNKDFLDITGNVVIEAGENHGAIGICTISDKIPEKDEYFQLYITDVTGGARITTPDAITLIVLENDYPVTLSPLELHIKEGDSGALRLSINKASFINTYVSIGTSPVSAFSSDFVSINETLIFKPGETSKVLSVRTIDDNIPELNETFMVTIKSASGDYVTFENHTCRVVILANDNPYGLFQFNFTNEMFVSEGDQISIGINRLFGTFGEVFVRWQAFDSSGKQVTTNELSNLTGTIRFDENETYQAIHVDVLKDGFPELDETITIKLVDVLENKGNLGERKEMNLIIGSSDYPNGVFFISSKGSSKLMFEDQIDQKDFYHGNITISREKGSFFSAKVLWEIYDTQIFGTNSIRVVDILMHGESMGTKNVEGRFRSSTPALEFEKYSCTNLSETMFPATFDINDGMSVTVWIKSSFSPSPEPLVEKIAHEKLVYSLFLLKREFNLTVITNSTYKESMVSFPSGISMHDGDWHIVVLTMATNGSIILFLDGLYLKEIITQYSLLTPVGTVTVGCSSSSPTSFIGSLQDVRLHPKTLTSRDVYSLSVPETQLVAFNGELVFGPGESLKSISVKIIEDTVPEPDVQYMIQIIDVKDEVLPREQAIISSTELVYQFTVVRSDFAYGKFQLLSDQCPKNMTEGSYPRNLAVVRLGGTFGTVSVRWEIHHLNGTLATQDFVNAYGTVFFLPGEVIKNISVVPFDDLIPEEREDFVFRLTTIEVDNISKIDHTLGNGALINRSQSSCSMLIRQNDHINGLLQLMSFLPSAEMGFIAPLKNQVNVSYEEGDKEIPLYIVRAQGTKGDVSVEWQTRGISAVAGKDFKQKLGSVLLKSGGTSAEIQVPILDNEIPELTKSLQIYLKNPTGGATIGAGGVLNINILPSDNALGMFSFKTMDQTVTEGSTARVTLQRLGSALAGVHVNWVIRNGSRDFELYSGEVYFPAQVAEKTFYINVSDDQVAELSETFFVEMLNVTGGSIDPVNSTMRITIAANDYPYGLFNFEMQTLSVREDGQAAMLKVIRSRGAYGHVRLFYTTVMVKSNVSRSADRHDVSTRDGFVDFSDQEIAQYVNVTIMDDAIPEIDEMFVVRLTSVRVLGSNSGFDTQKMIGEKSFLRINILKNDNANGVLQFSLDSIRVSEDDAQPVVNVTRMGGLYGDISFSFVVHPKSAIIGEDFKVETFNVQMRENQSLVSLPIFILQDSVPEFDETFSIELLPNKIFGGATIGVRSKCEVVILENDYPYGKIGFFDTYPVIVNEPTSTGSEKIKLRISREGGASGVVIVQWRSFPVHSSYGSDDIAPLNSNITFLSNEREKVLVIDVEPDATPEINETYTVLLESVALGKAVLDDKRKMLNITILLNDVPFGTVGFLLSSITTEEKEEESVISLTLVRYGGSYGDLKIFYRTNEIKEDPDKSASSGSDFETVLNPRYTIIQNGSFTGQINIAIHNDSIPELDEKFQVYLTKVEVVGEKVNDINRPTLTSQKVANVTILSNDHPYGMFQLSVDMAKNLSKYIIFEPENRNLPLTFNIYRKKGLFNSVSVSWRLAPGFTIDKNDVSNVDGNTITFLPGVSRSSFEVIINNDKLPERDEGFAIELYNATDGSVIDPQFGSVHLVISANDNAGGVVSFKQGSLSVIAHEGDNISLTIQRTHSQMGHVLVQWKILGENAAQDFENIEGNISLSDGQKEENITFQVTVDKDPEPDEIFQVKLISVETIGLSESGAAVLSQSASVATLSLGASDNPHGVIEFSLGSSPYYVNEKDNEIQLTIVRHFGKLGLVKLGYTIQSNNLKMNVSRASVIDDIGFNQSTVDIPDGVDSVKLSIPIVDDEVPEIDEGFTVKLMSVQLIDGSNSSSPPKLGISTQVEIVINANDDARGKLSFALESLNPVLEEKNQIFNLTVIRSLGTFGDVYCFYFLNQLTASAQDFYVKGVMNGGPSKLVFKNGETRATISVEIFDDELTEDREQFEIGLTVQNAIGNGGVSIGDNNRTVITIDASDGASGVIQFSEFSRSVVLREPDETSSLQSSFNFLVERKKGRYGVVQVLWQVTNTSRTSHDIYPLSGVITFGNLDNQKSFYVSAVKDDIPELNRTVHIELKIVSGGAIIGDIPVASVTILENDYPYGSFTFLQEPLMITEETGRLSTVTVQRNGGTFGEVFIDYKTVPVTATSNSGHAFYFGIVNYLNSSRVHCSHHLDVFGSQYMLLCGADSLLFYEWYGKFIFNKTLLEEEVVKIRSIRADSLVLLILQSSSSIHVGILQVDLALTIVQTIPSFGVTDVTTFSISQHHYLTYTDAVDRLGETVQDLQLYKWNGRLFERQTSGIKTFNGMTLDSIEYRNHSYLIVGNHYDRVRNSYFIPTNIYTWTAENRFVLCGDIQTNKVKQLQFQKISHLLVLGEVNLFEQCRIYVRNSTTVCQFHLKQIFLYSCNMMEFFKHGEKDFLLLVTSTDSHLYEWNSQKEMFDRKSVFLYQFVQDVSILYLNNFGVMETFFVTNVNVSSKSIALRLSLLSENADFIPSHGRLLFKESQATTDIHITVLKDTVSEIDERFSIVLSNASNGAHIPPPSKLDVLIMANGNPHGRFGFSGVSLQKVLKEDDVDVSHSFSVAREFGSFGGVLVYYEVNEHIKKEPASDIYPNQGFLNFSTGVTSQELKFFIKADSVPEVSEKFEIKLVRIKAYGTSTNLGASINYNRDVATVVILPNNNPFGVFGWEKHVQVSNFKNEVNFRAVANILRSEGAFGDVNIFYETYNAHNVESKERAAVPFKDYVPASGNITMRSGFTQVSVPVSVTHDGNRELNKIFYFNLTSVHLSSNEDFYSHAPPLLNTARTSLELAINEVYQENGVIEFLSNNTTVVDESVGKIQIPLVRQNGLVGEVSVYYRVSFGTASKPDVLYVRGVVTFAPNEASKMLVVDIVDDAVPELAEIFHVELTKPVGGVSLSSNYIHQVEIKENDYPYGTFSVKESHVAVDEGGTMVLPVHRGHGLFGAVDVSWKCEDRLSSDLMNTSGIIHFKAGEREQSIKISTIDDSIPEVDEVFECSLTHVNPGVLANRTTWKLTIKASDKPHGVLSIAESSRQVYVDEPGNFTLRVVRSVGYQDDIQVSWKIITHKPLNPKDTFKEDSGKSLFKAGEKVQFINVEVLDDSTPEEAETFHFYLLNPTGGSELNTNVSMTVCEVVVAASDHPYGVFLLQTPSTRFYDEYAGRVSIIVERQYGTISSVDVEYMIFGLNATFGEDFTPSNGVLRFDAGVSVQNISIQIIDDEIPEINEAFVVHLSKVTLNKTVDFERRHGVVTVNTSPMISRLASNLTIIIVENDFPYGTISFTESELKVYEWQKVVQLPVRRRDGSMNRQIVTYTHTAGSASIKQDFDLPDRQLVFEANQNISYIPLTIYDDVTPEKKETFQIQLTQVTGGAILGQQNTLDVVIERSDNPYGLFGLYKSSNVILENPSEDKFIDVVVSRKDGTASRIKVDWKIYFEKDTSIDVLQDAYPGEGFVIFNDRENNDVTITFVVRPYGGAQEEEETFIFNLTSASNGASIDDNFNSMKITVLKKGYPHGLFKLSDSISPSTSITEPTSGSSEVVIQILRSFGTKGAVKVYWKIESESGNILTDISYDSEKSVLFADGQTVGLVKLNVTADSEPELDENFVLTLLRTDNLGSIDTTRNTVVFVVLANDSPFGIFKLPPLGQKIRVNPKTLRRVFTITIERSAGHFQNVTATVSIEHRDHATAEVLVKVPDNQKTGISDYMIDNSLFLSNELPYTLRLKDVKLMTNSIKTSLPTIDSDHSLVRVNVPGNVANSRVEFTQDSLYVSSDTQLKQATFNVSRTGTYGPLKVTWKTGSHTQYDYLSKGTFTPASAVITFLHGVKSKKVTVQVNVPTDIKHSLIYSVYLSDVQPNLNELGWGKIGPNKYCIIDPHGVIQVAFQSRKILTLEGETIDIHFERILSVIGAVRVYYETGVYPRNTSAVSNKDFIATQSFVDFTEGEYHKAIKINTINDDIPEKDEDFFIRLTSVKCISKPLDSASPRLSSDVFSVITIQDNDLPYGIISFAPNSRNVKVLETVDYVELDIQRTDGSLSTTRVEVSTIGGSESWEVDTIKALDKNPDLVKALQSRGNTAMSGFDYNPVKRSLIFAQGFTDGLKIQKQSIRINIIKDDIAEPMEQFIVVLSNPTNGATLFGPHAYAVVTIEGNGLFNGEVGFQHQSPVIDEDGRAVVSVNVTRVGKSIQDISVSWELVRKDQPQLLDEFVEKSGAISIFQGKNGNSIQLRLKDDEKPEYLTWVLLNLTTISAGAIIKRTESITNVSIVASDYPAGRIGFDLSSRYPVLRYGDYTTLRVQRYNGSLSKISVKYATVGYGSRVKHGGVMFSPASEEIDFPREDKTLTFNVGQKQSFIDIRLPSTTNVDSISSPKVFNISLSDPSNGAILDPRYKSSFVIITKDVETRRFLNLFSRTLNLPLSEAETNKILEDLHISLQTSYSQKDLLLVKTTIENILNFKSSQPVGNKALSNTAKNSLLNVFNTIIKSIPLNANGYSYWVKVMEKAAYNFLEDQPPVILSYSRENFDMKLQRRNTSVVGDLVFLSGSDSFIFSADSFPASWEKSFADVHFISFKNAKLFAYNKAVLNNKILSSGMRNDIKKKGSKVTYRINSRSNRITSLDVSCVIWIYNTDSSSGYWSDKHCTVKSKAKTWVDCECQHLSEYAVLANSDDRTGYEIYFFIACFCTMGACFFALVSFHCFAAEKTFTSSLIMQMFFAVMITNMLFAIDAYLSPNFIYKQDSCSVMAMFLHYFILVQFTTMLAQACNLWRILIMNDEHSERKFIHFTLLAWGLPILIIVAYVFITFAVWGWKFVDMYADLHAIGDLCFIPAPYGALGVAVIPVLLCILVVGVVFVQAYQVTAQWKFYDDICRGRYNIREVRHIISIFILISLTWLFGGLHMVYGYLWMVILFTIFNVTTCLYILIVYVLLRNQMKHLLKGKYQIQQTPEHNDIAIIDKRDEAYKQSDMFADNHPNGIELGEWENAELPRVPSRAVSPQSVKSRYTEYNNPRLYHQHGNVNESYDSVELEATDFDDLMYALKTGGRFTPSVNADVIDKEENSMEDVSPPTSPQGGVSIRKLTIGDTHL